MYWRFNQSTLSQRFFSHNWDNVQVLPCSSFSLTSPWVEWYIFHSSARPWIDLTYRRVTLPTAQASCLLPFKILNSCRKILKCFRGHAQVLSSQGKYGEALPLFQRSLDVRIKLLGPERLEVAESLDAMAELYRMQGQYDEALRLKRRALHIREKVTQVMSYLLLRGFLSRRSLFLFAICMQTLWLCADCVEHCCT